MHRVNNYRISKESFEDMLHAGRFNPCLEIMFRDRTGQYTHKLSAGYGDVLYVYREGTGTYILSTNSMLGYVGLEVFEGADEIGVIFIEEYQIKDVFGRDSLVPFNAIKRLKEHIM